MISGRAMAPARLLTVAIVTCAGMVLTACGGHRSVAPRSAVATSAVAVPGAELDAPRVADARVFTIAGAESTAVRAPALCHEDLETEDLAACNVPAAWP